MKQKVALVYDRVNSRGGAEKILQELHTLYPDAPLYTSVYESERADWSKGWDVRPSFLQNIPFLRSRHQLVGWLMPLVFETFDLREYDIVISVTSEFCKAVITLPHQLHVSYILTPTRYLWSHSEDSKRSLPFLLRPLAQWVFGVLRQYDLIVARRPDVLVSISELVQKRVQQCYGLPSKVLYPPYGELPAAEAPKQVPAHSEFVLAWGRLVRYKKFSRVIHACCREKIPLVIVGEGPDFSRLKVLALQLDPKEELITFAGYQEAPQLSWFVEKAKVTVFPQIEDFGITALEAWLAGCQIVTQRQSGSSEILKDHPGVSYLEGENDENISALIRKAWESPLTRLDIRSQARQYAGERWRRDWSSLMRSIERTK